MGANQEVADNSLESSPKDKLTQRFEEIQKDIPRTLTFEENGINNHIFSSNNMIGISHDIGEVQSIPEEGHTLTLNFGTHTWEDKKVVHSYDNQITIEHGNTYYSFYVKKTGNSFVIQKSYLVYNIKDQGIRISGSANNYHGTNPRDNLTVEELNGILDPILKGITKSSKQKKTSAIHKQLLSSQQQVASIKDELGNNFG